MVLFMSVLNYVGRSSFNLLVELPFEVISSAICVVQTVGGVAASALSLVTIGQFPNVNNVARFTDSSHEILPNLYKGVVRVVNPNFTCEPVVADIGIISSKIALPIFNMARKAATYETIDELFNPINTWLSAHVISRGAYTLGTLVSPITRTADLALGIIAVTFSLIPCLGRAKQINLFAMRQLTSLGVINDVCVGLRGIVNPQQFRVKNIF